MRIKSSLKHGQSRIELLLCLVFVALFIPVSYASPSPEETLEEYFRFVYGAPGINEEDILHSNSDNWMLSGVFNASSIERIKRYKFNVTAPGVFAGVVGKDVFFLEIREGKIDPAFPLQGVYSIQKGVIRYFLYYSILQDKKTLSRIVTNIDNVDFGVYPAAAHGDMDVYGSILGKIPIIRTSTPEEDKLSKTVTYRAPLGRNGFEFHLLKDGGVWKIDSSNKIKVPLEFFFARSQKRKAGSG